MSVDNNKSLISWFLLESFNRRDLKVVDKVFSSDHRLHSPAIETGVEEGPEAIKAMIRDYLGSFWKALIDEISRWLTRFSLRIIAFIALRLRRALKKALRRSKR